MGAQQDLRDSRMKTFNSDAEPPALAQRCCAHPAPGAGNPPEGTPSRAAQFDLARHKAGSRREVRSMSASSAALRGDLAETRALQLTGAAKAARAGRQSRIASAATSQTPNTHCAACSTITSRGHPCPSRAAASRWCGGRTSARSVHRAGGVFCTATSRQVGLPMLPAWCRKPSSPQLIRRGMPAEGCGAHDDQPSCDHLRITARAITRARACTAALDLAPAPAVAAALEPLYDEHNVRLSAGAAFDETLVALIDPGRGKTRRPRLGIARGAFVRCAGVSYDFCVGRIASSHAFLGTAQSGQDERSWRGTWCAMNRPTTAWEPEHGSSLQVSRSRERKFESCCSIGRAPSQRRHV